MPTHSIFLPATSANRRLRLRSPSCVSFRVACDGLCQLLVLVNKRKALPILASPCLCDTYGTKHIQGGVIDREAERNDLLPLQRLARPIAQRGRDHLQPVDLPALESIVHNLLDNAVRYTTAGGNVVVGLRQDGALLHLVVQDDGQGIPATEQSRVFERFYRGLGHAANGSGLGLAIVRQAALRMGGQVRVGEGLNGRGVGFFVSIPDSHKA